MARLPSYTNAVAEAYDAATHIVGKLLSLDSDRFKVSLLFDEVHVSFVDELADPGARPTPTLSPRRTTRRHTLWGSCCLSTRIASKSACYSTKCT